MESRDFSPEFVFQFSRSSGPGGQNVNKVSTKVELRFNIGNSQLLTPEEKETVRIQLIHKITLEDEIILISQSERSQLKNKEKVIEKFYRLLEKALTPPKKRHRTKPPLVSKERRLEEKRQKAEVKENRKKPDIR